MITSFKTEGLGIGFDFDIELEKDKQIYCFIGKNGIGKTQLLENMAKSLIFSHSIFRADSQLKYSNLFNQKIIHDRLQFITLELPLGVDLNKIKIKDKNKDVWGFILFEHIGRNNSFICDNPIVFVGAKNRGFTKNIDTNNIKILSNNLNRFVDSFQRTLKYINGEGLEQEEIADWFASRLIINPNFITTNQNKIYEATTVLKLIDRLEPTINLITKNEDGSEKPNISFHEGKLLINGIPLDKLSTGYVSIIKIFQEIVAGYSGWTIEENLNEVDGIVFIDEIEPHLHISWQTKIIGILREFFPKTTFFISTHSPLVLAGLKSGEGYELIREDNIVKTKPIANIENYFLNDIVKEFFDVDLNKEKIAHVDKERQKKAKALLLNLVNTLQEDEQ
ncbi:MAG: AAA family ATPase [Methylococcales bacterium]|nr:AAA family ATPase [Methylococcales bacterium]